MVRKQMAATLLIIGVVIFGIALWFFRDTIGYYIKLYNAKQIGDKYYAEYKFINKCVRRRKEFCQCFGDHLPAIEFSPCPNHSR